VVKYDGYISTSYDTKATHHESSTKELISKQSSKEYRSDPYPFLPFSISEIALSAKDLNSNRLTPKKSNAAFRYLYKVEVFISLNPS
jgi:hypothetical protein